MSPKCIFNLKHPKEWVELLSATKNRECRASCLLLRLSHVLTIRTFSTDPSPLGFCLPPPALSFMQSSHCSYQPISDYNWPALWGLDPQTIENLNQRLYGATGTIAINYWSGIDRTLNLYIGKEKWYRVNNSFHWNYSDFRCNKYSSISWGDCTAAICLKIHF